MIALFLAAALPFLSGFDFSVVTSVDPSLKTGLFSIKMQSSEPVNVFYELLDKDGGAVADAIYEFSGSRTTVVDSIPDVRLWSAETPELYTLRLRVNGKYTGCHVGFKTQPSEEMKSVKLDGPVTIEDLALMRLAGINAINICNYPQTQEFYNLCDSLGFYVSADPGLSSHPCVTELPLENVFLYGDLVRDSKTLPEYYEVKHACQDIQVLHTDDGYQVFNRRHFTSLDGFKVRWWVERDGRRVKRGRVRLTAGPQGTQLLKVRLPRMKRPGEYWLFFESYAAKNKPLIAKGSVVATDSFLLGIVPRKAAKASPQVTNIVDGDTRIVIHGKSSDLEFDKVSGSFIGSGLRPNLGAVKGVSARVIDGAIVADYKLSGGDVLNVRYTLYENGTMHVESKFKGNLGFRFNVQADEYRFFGRSFTFKRIWKSTVQESTRHRETSWLRIGPVTVRQGAAPFEFTAHKHPGRDLAEVCLDRPLESNQDDTWDFTIKI